MIFHGKNFSLRFKQNTGSDKTKTDLISEMFKKDSSLTYLL